MFAVGFTHASTVKLVTPAGNSACAASMPFVTTDAVAQSAFLSTTAPCAANPENSAHVNKKSDVVLFIFSSP